VTTPNLPDVGLHLERTSAVRVSPEYADSETTGGRAPASFELNRRLLMAVLPRCIGSGFIPPSGVVMVATLPMPSGTSPASAAPDVGRAEAALRPADRLAYIERWLSLSVTQIAQVLSVGRQAIYRWRENAPLRPENARRLAALCDVGGRWADLAGVPLGSQVVTPLVGRGTLVDLLSASDWDWPTIDHAMRQLVPAARAEYEMLVGNPVEHLAARMDALDARAPTPAERAVNRAVQVRRGGRRG
jgi:hypothetical protein